MKSNRRLGALALATGAIVCGCSTEPIFKHRPGKTFGEIYVGDVRVSSRERLVNDRLQQDTWLQEQLKNSDSAEFAIQGASDQRSASLSSARVEANLDQTQVGAYRAQQAQSAEALRRQNELAEMDAQLQRQYKQRQLEYMQQQPASSFAYTPPSGAPQASQAVTPPTGPVTQEDLRKLKDDISKFTIPPNPVVISDKIKATPQDVLRDRLEYRGMIRNEIIDNALDDRHDLKGHTLLRFDMDATVRPHEDTSAWAVVEVELDKAAMASQCNASLVERWRQFVAREVYENTLRIMRATFPAGRQGLIGLDNAPAIRRAEAFVGGMVSTLPDHILFEIQKDWNETGKALIEMQNLQQVAPEIRGPMKVEDSVYATASAIVIHKARKGRPAEQVPLEDYVRTIHELIVDAYQDFANDVGVRFASARRGRSGIQLEIHREPKTAAAQRAEKKGALKLKADEALEAEPTEADVKKLCNELAGKISLYAYGTTPKESAQRISDVASRRNFNEVMLAMNFLAGNTAAGKAYFDMIKVNEGIFQALRRQPLAVGFNRSSENGNARFGWILGPRFSIRDDGQEANLRHTSAFNSLSGVLSLPGWLDEVTLKVRTYWVTESGRTDAGARTDGASPGKQAGELPFVLNSAGRRQLDDGPDFPGRTLVQEKTVKVRLKEDLTAITDALATRSIRAPRAFVRQHLLFAEGSPAQVTIPGQNLWRSPTVILGGQQADQVLVLPDMRGIIARFKEIKLPDTPERVKEKVPLTVWTSEGHTDVALVTITPLKPAEVKPVAALASPAVIGGKVAAIRLAPPQKSFYQMKVWVGAASGVYQEATVTEVSIDGTTAKVEIPKLDKAKSGEGAMLQVSIKHAPDNRPSAAFGGPMSGVYFATEEETKATVKPAAVDIAKLANTIFTVSLPEKADVLYPDTAAGFTVTVTSGTGSPVLDATLCNKENGKDLKAHQCAFKLSLPKGSKFDGDGEYKVTVTAKETKIPVSPEAVKVTLKPAAQQAKTEEPKKPDPKAAEAVKDAAKAAGKDAKKDAKKEEAKKETKR